MQRLERCVSGLRMRPVPPPTRRLLVLREEAGDEWAEGAARKGRATLYRTYSSWSRSCCHSSSSSALCACGQCLEIWGVRGMRGTGSELQRQRVCEGRNQSCKDAGQQPQRAFRLAYVRRGQPPGRVAAGQSVKNSVFGRGRSWGGDGRRRKGDLTLLLMRHAQLCRC
jgi:hypothetical protein